MARKLARRSSKRFRRNGVEYLWTAARFDGALKDYGDKDSYAVLVDADWSTSPANERATLLRIVGYLNGYATIQAQLGAPVVCGVPWLLYTEDSDVVIAKAPSIVASYAEDIMQCGSYYPAAVVSNTTGEGVMARQCSLELDIRVKRRVTQATQIILSTGHETTTGFETQLVGAEEATFRCLIKLA